MTAGVSTSTAASFDRNADDNAPIRNTTRKAWRTGPRVRGSMIAASRSNKPTSRAADVIAITAVIVRSGRHSTRPAASSSAPPTLPLASARSTPATPPIAGAARCARFRMLRQCQRSILVAMAGDDEDTDLAGGIVSDAPGREAIDAACADLYDDQEPLHWAPALPHRLGGKDPLDAISAYRAEQEFPHWHLISYGLSELYMKERED